MRDYEYYCFCGKGYDAKKRLNDHVRDCHGPPESRICQNCEKSFSDRKARARHVRNRSCVVVRRPIDSLCGGGGGVPDEITPVSPVEEEEIITEQQGPSRYYSILTSTETVERMQLTFQGKIIIFEVKTTDETILYH